MEFDTFNRFKLPVTGIIGNDACWSQIAREQVPMFNSSVAVQLMNENSVAEDLATQLSVIVDEYNEEQVTDILKEALYQNSQGTSSLVNVIIGKTDFREGSISV